MEKINTFVGSLFFESDRKDYFNVGNFFGDFPYDEMSRIGLWTQYDRNNKPSYRYYL